MENKSDDIDMGPIQSYLKPTKQENESQADPSSEEDENHGPSEKSIVKVDVHAEMSVNVDEMTETLSQSSLNKPIVKKLMKATAEQSAAYDEMFSIDFDEPWQTVSQNLHRYRIKPEEKTPRKPFEFKSSASASMQVQPAKIPWARRNQQSLTERPTFPETPKRETRKSSFIQAGQSIATPNRGQKRKSMDDVSPDDAYVRFQSSSDSDENQENTRNNSSTSLSLNPDRSPSMFYVKKRSALSTMSPQSQVTESNESSLFDAIASGPKYNMGSEIDSSKNPITLVTYGKDQSFKCNLSSDSDSDGN